MADFLYDRMSRRMQRTAIWLALLVWLSLVGTIIFIAYHFITKFW